MKINENQWNLTIQWIHQWKSMKIHEIKQFNESINTNQWNPWESMKWIISMNPLIKTNENQWTSMKLNNSMNPSIEINGNPWESMKCINSINPLIKINENQWTSMKLNN